VKLQFTLKSNGSSFAKITKNVTPRVTREDFCKFFPKNQFLASYFPKVHASQYKN